MSYKNAVVSNLEQGYWECLRVGGTHKVFCRSKSAASFSPVLALRVAGLNPLNYKIEMRPISGLVGF